MSQVERSVRRPAPVAGRDHSVTACEWRVGPPPTPEHRDELRIVQRIGRDGEVRYAVTWLSYVANHDCQWEYEPIPSSRDDAFFERCRFDEWEDAYQVAIRMPFDSTGAYVP